MITFYKQKVKVDILGKLKEIRCNQRYIAPNDAVAMT